jgi:arsenite methyltransferase
MTQIGEDPQVVKACCASAYGHDLAGFLLGESFHPGGTELSLRLATTIGLQDGDRVVDVASGIGTTAILLAGTRDVEVLGIDLGEAQVQRAGTRAIEAGVADRVRFRLGDAEHLPLEDESADAVVCECALCTFPDKAAAVAEIARILRPGGRAGITDVWLDPERLDPDLQGLAARVACIADARPIDEIRDLLDDAGLAVEVVERHDDALLEIIDRVTARLRLARLIVADALDGIDVRRAVEIAGKAAAAVQRGEAGYMLITATKR